ncbi:MAG: hypothetical protein D6704_02490 [Nitrospirae bacterium]|nr:MAG: hypothetical protein D6704_02490 [Nitrospirota bacterium]
MMDEQERNEGIGKGFGGRGWVSGGEILGKLMEKPQAEWGQDRTLLTAFLDPFGVRSLMRTDQMLYRDNLLWR